MVINADAFHIPLADESVHCAITSPPYWGLRDYGIDNQLGLEETPELYVEHMVQVFREIKRVLRKDGTAWLNLGDSYAGSGKGGQSEEKRSENWQPTYANKGMTPLGLKPKDLVGIPWKVAFALQEDGWWLRSDVIWNKPNPMPESVTDRPTKSHEYVFLLAKSGSPQFWTHPERAGVRAKPEPDYEYTHKETGEKTRIEPDRWRDEWKRHNLWHGHDYYYDADAIREGFSPLAHANEAGGSFSQAQPSPKHSIGKLGHYRGGNSRPNPAGRNKRSVWTVTTKPFKGAHFATFPPDLVEPMVLAGCPETGVVLDPFCGTGTVGMVARRHGRRFVGLDLSLEYLKEFALARGDGLTPQHKIKELPLWA